MKSTASMLVLTTAAVIGSAEVKPAQAADGIYGGGSSLVSLTLRQIFDCYTGTTLFNDGYTFSSSFNPNTPTPGLLPTTCTVSTSVVGLFAAVGSGNGFRGYIANDPRQFFSGTPNSTVSFPATPPPYIDTSGTTTALNKYPYPIVDFGSSDSPLSATSPPTSPGRFVNFSQDTDWQIGTVTTNVTATGTVVATYSTGSFGDPIQLPLIAAPVAIAINTNGMNIQSGSSTPSKAGGAIQLTTAQICAIFAGEVKDWSETKQIVYLDSAGAKPTQAFNAANIGGGNATPALYAPAIVPPATTSLPIKVVYRSDSSGTSFIITNYLKSVCPQLDNGAGGGGVAANKYAAIFGSSNLPSNTFSNLITNINAAFPGANRTANWLSASLSQGVADAINNVTSIGATTYTGRIGYLSVDFTQPFLSTSTATYSPQSASVQNENLRAGSTYLPASSSGGANPPTFIPPAPAGGTAAFTDLDTPASGAGYNDWNIYAQTWPVSTPSGGINLDGLSRVGIPTAANSYPIMGTAFIGLYTCYRDDTGGVNPTARADRIRDFLSWFYAPDSTTTLPRDVLANNGFSALSASLRDAALTAASAIEAGGSGACTGITGG